MRIRAGELRTGEEVISILTGEVWDVVDVRKVVVGHNNGVPITESAPRVKSRVGNKTKTLHPAVMVLIP